MATLQSVMRLSLERRYAQVGHGGSWVRLVDSNRHRHVGR